MYREQRDTLIAADEFVRKSEPRGGHETTSLQPKKGKGTREDTLHSGEGSEVFCKGRTLVSHHHRPPRR